MGRSSNKDLLLQSGFDVIWEKGYDAASVKDITDAAGLPKGSFYNYFESKEQFALEGLNYYRTNIVPPFDTSKPPKERFKEILDTMHKRSSEMDFSRDCFASTLGHVVNSQNDEFREAVYCCMKDMVCPLNDLLHEMQDNGDLPKDTNVEDLADFIDMSIRGALQKSKVEKNDHAIKVAKEFVLKLIGA